MELVNLIAGIVTIVAFGFAVWQHRRAAHQERREQDRIALQRERLVTAKAAAISGAETADLIVQRTKAAGVRLDEVQNLARVMRGNLRLLVQQLDEQDEFLEEWRYDLLVSSGDDEDRS